MIIKSIHLKEGLFERNITFSDSANLVFSERNTRGKTTLLRSLLYGLGYSIPNTRRLKFDRCEITLTIEADAAGSVTLFRNNTAFIEAQYKRTGEKITYVLPEQQQELHSKLWGIENTDILNNLLGAFYVDQEKGWTLINRGVVIGSIHFNIEELIRGLSNTDCSELIAEEARVARDLGKYRQMFSVAQYRESLSDSADSLVPDSYEDEISTEIDKLQIDLQRSRAELRRIDGLLSDNRKFKKFVAEMKLLVQAPDGSTFPVTEDNIVGLTDSIELLVAKRKIEAVRYGNLSSQLSRLKEKNNHENEQLSFIQSASLIESFDKTVSRLPLNPVAIKKEIASLEARLKAIRDEITTVTKLNNKVASSISDNLIKYATELGIGDKDSLPGTYLFTSNLKELSGAVYHKTAFAFRLAYIIAIETVTGVKLPIILDSPSGKEIDQENVNLMMDILKRDFSDHQIIIASIYKYDFPELRIIEIKNRLIEPD